MKTGFFDKIISVVLAGVMLISAPAVLVRADDAAPGKYVSDVFIAYGKSQDEANKWLTDNGWEPISGNNDLAAGKASAYDKDIVAAMGIKRTNDAEEAITDMAVMNMTGGYSFPDFESLLAEKKADIDEFINTFIPVLEEYRENYNGNGSASGKARADLAYEVLNRFYDGDPEDKYAVNDTGKHLGDLFLEKTRQEGNASGADLQQMILESTGPAMLAVEEYLAFAADTDEETWIERLRNLSEEELTKNISKYVPEAEGQDLAPSAVTSLLNGRFADTAKELASQWNDVHNTLEEYEKYNQVNDLWQHDDEDDEAYAARVDQFFTDMQAQDEERYNIESQEYYNNGIFYIALYNTPYSGSWGQSLGDFFGLANGIDISADYSYFLPMAAALSEGQRAALNFLSLKSLIYLGLGDEDGIAQAMPDIDDIFAEGIEELSIYTGVNRGVFRGGVALTNNALMEQNMGRGSAFDKIWDNAGVVAIVSYCAAAVGVVTVVAGAAMVAKGFAYHGTGINNVKFAKGWMTTSKKAWEYAIKEKMLPEIIEERRQAYVAYKSQYEELAAQKYATKMGIAGRWVLGIGGALLIGAAIVKGIQMSKYYHRTFTAIPAYIVDEADIVSYTTDSSGNEIKNIEFDTYVFYEAVKCNRQEVGKISDWQDGVDDYDDWGCGDVADLNVDQGQEWLALYTVRSEKKGDPILADSLKVQYGSDKQPEGTTQALHFFTYTYAADLGDKAYSFNNKKDGVYLFWDSDTQATANKTASAFSGGTVALAAAGGLLIGVIAATLVLIPRRRKKEEES